MAGIEQPKESISSPTEDPNVVSGADDSDDFQCCICLELLYKPIVLGCGHISCFWCVHKSMISTCRSHCPVCRQSYNHFPGICRLLHAILVKLYPVAYNRREKQVSEEEKKMDCFSPQLDDDLVMERFTANSCNVFVERTFKSEVVDNLDHDTFHDYKTACPESFHLEDFKDNEILTLEKNLDDGQASGMCKQVSLNDVLCVACKQLLVRPVVLNCGHVHCESCILTSKDESIKCQECQSSHPGVFPKVCLELDHFLVEQFPEEYVSRREASSIVGPSACVQVEGSHSKSSNGSIKGDIQWWHENESKVHFGVGCDSCGLSPIIGKRYKCLDCKESIGFDLCEDCYNTGSKLPGRFNQRHTPEHRFQLFQPEVLRGILIRIMTDPSEDGSDASVLSNDASEEDSANRN